MNWSAYSRFVGDIFGAPLAMEGLIAFFLESTFLGLWIFGRDMLSPRVHLATIWLAAAGTTDQRLLHPRRQQLHAAPGRSGLRPGQAPRRADLDLEGAVQLHPAGHLPAHGARRLHDRGGAAAVGQRLAPAPRQRQTPTRSTARSPACRLGVLLVGRIGITVVGHVQGQIMTDQQPMKMAAAEALWDTKSNAPFSLFAYGDVEPGQEQDRRHDPGRPVDPGHEPARWHRPGHQRRPGGRGGQVRPRQLRAGRLAGLLVLPADDRLRASSPA